MEITGGRSPGILPGEIPGNTGGNHLLQDFVGFASNLFAFYYSFRFLMVNNSFGGFSP